MFMQTQDFRPDVLEDQVVDTYTVGFTTSPFANAVLEKTAQVGNGLFFHSNDAEELAEAIVSALTDIIRKSQSFTAATVPATRTATNGNLYTSSFVPTSAPYWEGHLQSYQITAAGEIHDANDVCALDDDTPGECFNGPFLASAVPFWDAGEEVPAPASRKLYTSLPSVSGRVDFDDNLSASDLGVVFPPAAAYPGSTALGAEGLTDEIIQNVRGCELGTGVASDVSDPQTCAPRPWLLGDIFHSGPIVVGSPAAYLPESSYKRFEGLYGHAAVGGPRPSVLYAGANDGFLRGFLAGTWNAGATPPAYDTGSGQELFGFMPWPARQNIPDLPVDTGSRDHYFVDATPSVADVWLYSNPLNAGKVCNDASDCEWYTVLIGGLREGGRAYYALDITDPEATGYPALLWEFPRENDASGLQNFVGETWSEPILTKIRVRVGTDDNTGLGYERWVAIFAGGYHPSGDPNDHAAYDPNATAGRGIFVLDIATGELIAEKHFDVAALAGDPEGEMRFALASTPGVYDLDFDGFADVIYVGDLGGNVWKWVIGAMGEDPVNDVLGDTSQPDWSFKKFFQAPSYNDGFNTFYKSFFFAPAATFKNNQLWLAFGSGERANPRFMGDDSTLADNNRFYALRDVDPHEIQLLPEPTLTETSLLDVTANESCVNLSAFPGYFFTIDDNEKFVTDVDLFMHYVVAAAFTPNTTVAPCEASGETALYVFKVHCGEGFFEDVLGDPDRKLDLGSGVPSTPKITIGTEGDGSNKIIINTTGTGNSGSNTEIESLEAPGGFESGLRQFYWRELTQ
jgi:type IV pilus assembly protein PilY1